MSVNVRKIKLNYFYLMF